MKNASLIFNVVLLIAVVVLFYLHFSSDKQTEQGKSTTGNNSSSVSAGEFRVAYFEMDSITNSLQMVKDVKEELTKEETRINNELTRMQKALNDKLVQYQSQGQTMSSIESEKANREIRQMQETFGQAQQQMQQELQKLQFRRRNEVHKTITDYLKEYTKGKGYSMIFSGEPELIFYRDTTLDITRDIITALNKQYKKK